jgi:hypothetical protein
MQKFRGQFLLTKEHLSISSLSRACTVGEFSLYHHAETEVTTCQRDDRQVVLIGYWNDYRHPTWSNQEILDYVAEATTWQEAIERTYPLAGVYLLLFATKDSLVLIPDFCCTREAFIRNDETGISIGASTNILEAVRPFRDQRHEFYSSEDFNSKRTWISHTTHLTEVIRLKPNHYYDLQKRQLIRFFPTLKRPNKELNQAVEEAAEILKGTLASITHREPIVIGFTAGWDSRLLLAASRWTLPSTLFYVNRNTNSPAFDYRIPMKLAWKLHVPFVYSSFSGATKALPTMQLDYPFPSQGNLQGAINYLNIFGAKKTVSGNISEIARNEYGIIHQPTGKRLASFLKYPGNAHCTAIYDRWIQDHQALFESTDYLLTDLFYWEESLGNKLGKSVSEAAAVGRQVFPAFNCRALMLTLLSVEPRFRSKQENILYQKIAAHLWPESLTLPVNPGLKKIAIKYLQRLGIYDLYKNLRS